MKGKDLHKHAAGSLVQYMGIEWEHAGDGSARAQLRVQPHHLAPNGYLHAATVIAIADSCCGYGCMYTLPQGANNFATVELKSNFIGTARSGLIICHASLVHGGRTTQLWDAVVKDEAGEAIALFRCTQMILYPR